MGRFETSAAFYGYREPYSDEFFSAVGAKIGVTAASRLLDVGCRPGNLAIGFARLFPGVAVTAIDIEPAMLAQARTEAAAAHVQVTFLQKAIEDVDFAANSFDLVTVGRALHWLPREKTLAVWDRVLGREGKVAICSSRAAAAANPWEEEFRRVRRAFADDPDESRYHVDLDQWFAGPSFGNWQTVSVPYRHRVTILRI